jgi:hypothetical protein
MAYSVIMEQRNKLSSAAGKGGLIDKELRNMKHQYQLRMEGTWRGKRHTPLVVAPAASKSMVQPPTQLRSLPLNTPCLNAIE